MSLKDRLKDYMGFLETRRDEFKRRRDVLARFPGTRLENYVVIKGHLENLELGENVTIQSGTVLHLGGFDWCRNKGFLKIGDNGVISPNCVLYGAGPAGIRIGKGFDCAPGVSIFSSISNYGEGDREHIFAPVEIGDNVIIFANSVISPGVKIGDNAVIAAGSVVTRDIPANSLAGGTPAKVITPNTRHKKIKIPRQT